MTLGDKPVVLRLDGIGIGLATCYDLRFPALFARLADEVAEIRRRNPVLANRRI